jgi:hypothetical protein
MLYDGTRWWPARVHHIHGCPSHFIDCLGGSISSPYHQKKLSNQVKVGQLPGKVSTLDGLHIPLERQLEDSQRPPPTWDALATKRSKARRRQPQKSSWAPTTSALESREDNQTVYSELHSQSFQPEAPFIM